MIFKIPIHIPIQNFKISKTWFELRTIGKPVDKVVLCAVINPNLNLNSKFQFKFKFKIPIQNSNSKFQNSKTWFELRTSGKPVDMVDKVFLCAVINPIDVIELDSGRVSDGMLGKELNSSSDSWKYCLKYLKKIMHDWYIWN